MKATGSALIAVRKDSNVDAPTTLFGKIHLPIAVIGEGRQWLATTPMSADWLSPQLPETTMEASQSSQIHRSPWNKGKLVGQKAPFKLKDIWAIRVRLQLSERRRELALFNLAIDSKLRGCDLVQLRVRDICQGQAFRRARS